MFRTDMLQTGRRVRSAALLLLLAGGAITGVMLGGLGDARGQQGEAQLSQGSGSFAGLPSFADVVDQVNPSVVTVAVTVQPVAWQGGGSAPWQGSPFDEFLNQFGGMRQLPAPTPRQGVGSGFIIDADGYIATNNHVVEQASRVMVTLASGEELEGRVVGTDPRTDLALIKVESSRPLPALALGDSDRARVGDWVIAIGNPFGLGGTATAGIISARGRDIRAGAYDDFLQIDAAINSGNSGGPVFNSAGEVIGINTAIFSPTGGSVGIGFAIPSNQARDVLDELRTDGVVSRGWLGVSIDVVDAGQSSGALIAGVEPMSPAEAAGIEAGDIVTRFDGQAIESPRTLSRLVGERDAGDEIEIEITRNGASRELAVELGELDEARLAAAARPEPQPQPNRRAPQAQPFYRR